MNSKGDWRPSAAMPVIKARAELLTKLRQFMAEREVMEVETPYLSHAYNSDPNLSNFRTACKAPDINEPLNLYLHTSPEFPMKRLLAADCGSIYQIARVFRDAELGRQHNPEFTMLEWYRIGFDHHQLMDEVNELLSSLGLAEAERLSYEQSFYQYTGLNPHTASDEELISYAEKQGLITSENDRASMLDFIFSHKVVGKLGHDRPCFIHDYPASQAALAKTRQEESHNVAERFELFISGMEIANGYNELTDADELKRRFKQEQSMNDGPLDEYLLTATAMMPECAGIALGVDRLLMALLRLKNIDEVLTFPLDKA